MSNSLQHKRIAILATHGFEHSELTVPKEILEAQGAEVDIISPEKGHITSWKEGNWGDSFGVDQTLEQAAARDFNGLVLPGGVINPDSLRTNSDAINFIKGFTQQEKPVAAICHGPWTLIDAGAVDGKQITSFKSLRRDLENAGATWQDEAVVIDGSIITSRTPKDLEPFTETLITALQQAA